MDTRIERDDAVPAVNREPNGIPKPLHADTESVEKENRYGTSSDAGSIMKQSPDFFSHEVFQMVLHNPTTAHQLLKFSQSRFCAENIDFLDRVSKHMYALLCFIGTLLF